MLRCSPSCKNGHSGRKLYYMNTVLIFLGAKMIAAYGLWSRTTCYSAKYTSQYSIQFLWMKKNQSTLDMTLNMALGMTLSMALDIST